MLILVGFPLADILFFVACEFPVPLLVLNNNDLTKFDHTYLQNSERCSVCVHEQADDNLDKELLNLNVCLLLLDELVQCDVCHKNPQTKNIENILHPIFLESLIVYVNLHEKSVLGFVVRMNEEPCFRLVSSE